MSAADTADAPILDLPDSTHAALLQYGLLVDSTPHFQRFWNGSAWQFNVHARHSGNTILYYRPDVDRFTYGWAQSRLAKVSPYFAKVWKRNGDQATFNLTRLLRDFDRLSAVSDINIAPELVSEALDYYLNFNARLSFPSDSPAQKKVIRSWEECLVVANLPAADKSVVKEMWGEPLPVDVLLLAVQGLNLSLLREFTLPEKGAR